VFVGRAVLGGQAEIAARLPRELERFRRDPQAYQDQAVVPFGQLRDTRAMRADRFEALSLPVVLAAGLLDGVNPCAFTTIIFLLSYLSLAGGTRRRLLVTGGLFTLAVFVTYVLIGVLFYQLASTLLGNRLLATVVHVVLLVLLLVLAALSVVDAVRCWRGRPTEMALKLPKAIQDRLRARIRAFARNDLATGTAALSLGVVVASLELACTGQIYIPIVTMIAEPQYRAAAALNLLAYNVAFIVPLVAVFLLVSLGITSQRLARFASRHLGAVKLALALLFVALALVVLYNLGWLP
jgi:cytochrome c biogenesis protein CcdA